MLVRNILTILTGTSWDNTYNFINFSNNVHIYGLLQLGTITNVETVLTGLASTYATISSLSAYVKTSLANTFSALQTFSAGIGLPTYTLSQMSTSGTIGHTIPIYATATVSSPANNLFNSFGSFVLPTAGVWLISVNIKFQFGSAPTGCGTYISPFNNGTATFSSTANILSGTYINATESQTFQYATGFNTYWRTVSTMVWYNTTANQTMYLGGLLIWSSQVSSWTGTYFGTATRIA